jgi:hypothetical protein
MRADAATSDGFGSFADMDMRSGKNHVLNATCTFVIDNQAAN